eukprot:GHVO01057585.1.p1 GENE.GHVO01057585.1~~GHVO01057585.1.p1  ORF type:complete len:254 (-),score=16.65 GHVO01057585.1:523-1182(-)
MAAVQIQRSAKGRPDTVTLPRLAILFQGITAQIRLAIGKAKGEDWSEPSGEYASMPKLFEMHSLAGAAALFRFEAEHLKWALDLDEKTNPDPNKERVERNHRAVSKMDDFQITLNKDSWLLLSKYIPNANPPSVVSSGLLSSGLQDMDHLGELIFDGAPSRIEAMVSQWFCTFSPFTAGALLLEKLGFESPDSARGVEIKKSARRLIRFTSCVERIGKS